MQNTASKNALPPMGPNKIQQALQDYSHMEHELVQTRTQLREYVDIANRLHADNEGLRNQLKVQGEFLTRQIDLLQAERNRLLEVNKGIRTHFSAMRGSFDAADKELQSIGITVNETIAELSDEDEAELKTLELGRPLNNVLPANRFS